MRRNYNILLNEHRVNCSKMNSTADGWDKLPIYVLYSVQGLIISVSNIFIVLSIIRHEALRTSKEYLLMFGLSLADSVNMTGFWTAGLHRINLVRSGHHGDLCSPWECATKLHNIFLIWGIPWNNMMLLLLSIDRMICMRAPLTYLGYTRNYSYGILLFGFGVASMFAFGFYAIAFFDSGHKFLLAPCLTYDVLKVAPTWLAALYQTVPASFAFLSVLVYLGVWCKHRNNSQINVRGASTRRRPTNAEQLARQHRVTVTLALSCLFTFGLYCVPMMLANVFLWFGSSKMSLFLYFLSTFNPLCNVFLYQIRHKEMQVAMIALFTCRTLPIDIRMWGRNQTAHENNVQNRISTL